MTPKPGFASIIVPSKRDMYAIVANIESMLSEGLSVSHLRSSLETPRGKEYAGVHTATIKVATSDVLWVPYGWVAMPLLRAISDKAPKGGDSAFAIWTTIWSSAMVKALPPTVWQAIRTWNDGHLKKQKNSRLYSARCELFERFAAAVQA